MPVAPDAPVTRPAALILAFDFGERRIGVAVGNTGRRTSRSSAESSPSCSNTSPRSIFNGLLITIPRAPAELCSQISVTDWAKFGSAMPGMAIRNWFVK